MLNFKAGAPRVACDGARPVSIEIAEMANFFLDLPVEGLQ